MKSKSKMANVLNKCLTLILLVSVTAIECQVVLNRNQLATWIPSYLTDTSMNLNSRSISLIDTATFSGLSNLKNLYLDRNKLTHLDPDTFSSLSNLQHLYLKFNSLTNIDSNTFSGLTNLNYLNLEVYLKQTARTVGPLKQSKKN
jgi:Leucine-rich repeat (LRR) protein